MKILTWTARFFILLFLFAFAVRNTDPVQLNFLLGQSWQAPLAIVLLVFLAGGALLGVLSLLGLLFRQRREIGRLKKQLAQSAGAALPAPAAATGPVEP